MHTTDRRHVRNEGALSSFLAWGPQAKHMCLGSFKQGIRLKFVPNDTLTTKLYWVNLCVFAWNHNSDTFFSWYMSLVYWGSKFSFDWEKKEGFRRVMWLFKNYIAEKSLTEHSFGEVHLLGVYYSRDKTWGSMDLARTKNKQKQTQISASKELIFFSLHG